MVEIKNEYPFTVVGSSFTEIFYEYLDKIMNRPEFKMNPRGTKTKGITGSTMILTNPRNRVAYVPGRKYKIAYGLAEFLWYMSGSDRLNMITNYAPSMANYSDDGKTVRSGYGDKIFGRFYSVWNQMNYILKKFKQDKNTRQAIIMIRDLTDSMHDIKCDFKSKDIPCTLYLHFQIISNKLHLTVAMRSQDLLIGKMYDVFTFTMIQEWVYLQLLKFYPNLGLGNYIMHDDNVHIYSNWYKRARKILDKFSGTTYHWMNAPKKKYRLLDATRIPAMRRMESVDIEDVLDAERSMRENYLNHNYISSFANHHLPMFWREVLALLQWELWYSKRMFGFKPTFPHSQCRHFSYFVSNMIFQEDGEKK